MILMIITVIAILIIAIIYMLKGIYVNKFDLEGSLKGFKLSFEATEKKKDTSSCKKQCLRSQFNYLTVQQP